MGLVAGRRGLSSWLALAGFAALLPGPASAQAGQPGCGVLFTDSRGRQVQLVAADYRLSATKGAYLLTIVNPAAVAAIEQLKNADIVFCYKKKKLVAKGNPVYSSAVPAQADAFYPINRDSSMHLGVSATIRMHDISKLMSRKTARQMRALQQR